MAAGPDPASPETSTVHIHPTALVSPQAQIGSGVSIGPFSIIEPDVVIEDNCQLAARVVVKSGTTLGANNIVHEGTVLGGYPQHARMPERLGTIKIGAGNTFRENCTVHRALNEGGTTNVGSNSLFMVGAHIAHDCQVADNVIMANNALLGGFVTVGDRAFVSGAVAVHQFCRIGRLAMVGGCARVVQDIPPYVMVDGRGGLIVGLNLVGLRRNGYTATEVSQLKAAYRVIYRQGLPWKEVLEALKQQFTSGPAADFQPFLAQGTRGFVQERRMPPNATIKLRTSSEEDGDSRRYRAAG